MSARAETEDERRERIERLEELRRTEEVTGASLKLGSELVKRLGWFMEYGGTGRYTYTGGDDNDRAYGTQDSQEFSKDYELNLFLNMVDLRRVSKFYTRLRSTYTERKKNSATTRGNEWKELEVDLMYYERKYKGKTARSTLTLGRQFVSVGKGIAYSAAADGIHVKTNYKRNDITLFAVKADRSPDDHDPGTISPPSRGHTHRHFFGGEFKWNFSAYGTPYFYYVENKYKGLRTVDGLSGQVHIYEPTFIGYGMDGKITDRLSYFSEFVHAYGTTNTTGDQIDTTRVNAGAWDAGLRYRFPGVYNASVAAEFGWASGDPDRQTTVNSSLLGNRSGDDESFRAFGGLSLGYAFAPTFVNLAFKKYTGNYTPFAKSAVKHLRSIRVTADFYEYSRAVTPGPISDLAAFADNRAKKRVGREFDLQVRWQIFNDLDLSVRWGKFLPHPDSFGDNQGQNVRRGADPEIYWRFQCSLDL
ncbi:alginate export family protein [bacterium]|nr:alginate export family protein [bacterium]